MATTSMRCIFAIFLAAVCCQCQSDNPDGSFSWAELKISPVTLNTLKYGNLVVDIYEDANNHKATTTASQKKYFYSPIALLDHKSAVSKFNRFTKQQEMIFRIEMWNDKIENEVVKHLNKIVVGQDIQPDNVRVIPLEKVILTSQRPTADYSLFPEWTFYDKSPTLRLSLLCYDQKICDELANAMRSDPEQFNHFKLRYSLSSQTSQTKQTTISIDSVTSGQLVSTLLHKFKTKKEIFLTANDEKKMLAETATNIRMETFNDFEVGSPDTEVRILNILKNLLITSRETIKEQSDHMWDSVFWNEDNYRPDKTTKNLNDILNKLDKETQNKLTDMFHKAKKKSVSKKQFVSGTNDKDIKREGETIQSNQTKEANENENKRSQATDGEQTSRNQTHDDKSNTNKVDTDITGSGWGVNIGAKVGVDLSNTHKTEQENEKSEKSKNNSDEYGKNSENKEGIHHNYDKYSWADVGRISSTISGKMANESDGSRRVEILKEDVEKLLHESRDHVQWDGEKFVPKPMQLSRINLAKFRDSQSFQDRIVRVRYTTAELSAQIKITEYRDLTVTDEWNNLKAELKATTELLSTTVNNLVKTNTELSIAKSDLTNTRIDLTNTRIDLTDKLEGTKQELEKTRANVNNLSTKLNDVNVFLIHTETKQELVKTRADFTITVDDLSAKLNATEKELETKITAGKLSTELRMNSDRLGQQLKDAEDNLKKDLKATSTDLETTKTTLASTRTELRNAMSVVADLTTELNARTSEIVDIGQMPTSCADLERMGHKLSGFFSVKGSKKMEMIYCDLNANQNNKQKWIGYPDVKSAPVHFYVQRNSSFSAQNTPIPFDLAVVNEGNAMNLTSGKFTAPRPGIYFFSFEGVAKLKSSSLAAFYSCFFLNGNRIARSLVQEENGPVNQFSPVILQSTLNLKEDDQLWVEIEYYSYLPTFLHDDNSHRTQFTGFMLEEEIVASL